VEAGERLRAWWNATDAGVKTRPASEAKVAALEQRYHLTLPDDFRRYLLTACPEGENEWDTENTIWWPLHRIRNVPEEYEHPIQDERIAAAADKYLFFADYMIWCWAWAICCADGPDRGRVALIGGLPDRIVADNFDEFVDRYIRNWASVS